MRQYLDRLWHNPLFAGVTIEELPSLLTCLSARLKTCARHETVFHQGQPVGEVGIVCTGGVQILREDFLGNRTIVAHIGEGDLFGEAFACARVQRLPVRVAAVVDSVVLLIDYAKIITTCSPTCDYHSRLIENMMGILAGKNVHLNQKLDILSRRSTRDKLVAFLSACARSAGNRSFSIDFNRQELADYLCVDRSAMTTELTKLRGEGVVDFDRNRFTLLAWEDEE